MKPHPLLATVRRTRADTGAARPHDAIYDFVGGIWIGPEGPLCDDPLHIPVSKKDDIETGEDQKGQ